MAKIKLEFDFTRTAKALEWYDLWSKLPDDKKPSYWTEERAHAWMRHMEQARRRVGRCYGLDTAPINSPDTCESCIVPGSPAPGPGEEESFVRRMVRQWKEASE